MNYKTIIGLEVHCQLDTKSKMFCTCANGNKVDGAEPNTNMCEVCMGHPGTLPIANRQAVEWTVLAGLAINCDIPKFSKFDRKHYFYPDLPKGYQISQYDLPFCKNGHLELTLPDGKVPNIRVNRIHLEEDAAKNTHPAGANYSLVDYNRAGAPLMEIVSEPDITSPLEARIYMQELQKIMRYLGVSKAEMEKGHMRCDANISLVDESGKSSGIVEIKNMNSFRSVEKSLEYEQKRIAKEMDEGTNEPRKTTRGWDDGKQQTFLMRVKEQASDYRYFPEPDLPPFTWTDEDIERFRTKLPELPKEKLDRFQREFALSVADAELLIASRDRAEFFEGVVSEITEWTSSKKMSEADTQKVIKLATNYILSELLKYLKEGDRAIADLNVSPENFAELMVMTYSKEINSSATQKVLKLMIETGGDPSEIVKKENLGQVSDTGELESIASKIIAANPGPVADYKAGKQQALQFLVGQMMKETKGKANPQVARELLQKQLR